MLSPQQQRNSPIQRHTFQKVVNEARGMGMCLRLAVERQTDAALGTGAIMAGRRERGIYFLAAFFHRGFLV